MRHESSIPVAEEIHMQIGAPAFYMMGAKNLVGSEHGLAWKVMRNANGVTHVRVTLTDADLYDVEFLGVKNPTARRSGGITTISKVEGIFADGLHEAIREGTGLELVVPRVSRVSR
jgi:hypothetical protein